MLSSSQQGETCILRQKIVVDRCITCSLGDSHSHIRKVCGEDVVKKCSQIWGLNKEGELNGTWRDMRVKGLWYMMGMWLHTSSIHDIGSKISDRKFGTLSIPLEACCAA